MSKIVINTQKDIEELLVRFNERMSELCYWFLPVNRDKIKEFLYELKNNNPEQKQALINMMRGIGKEKQTCKNCKFNNEQYCTVGTHYAEKGLNKFCYEGELWEGK